MSPFKRTERAKAKARARGQHAKPAPEQLRGGPLPVGREPFVQLLGSPQAFGGGVPVELASRDYEFPRVQVPQSRPIVSAGELLEALDGDDEPTQPIPVTGTVLDGEPQPARHAGLAPAAAPHIPVPDNPFLNAGAPHVVHRAVTEPGGWHTVREVWRTGCGTSAPRGECTEDDSAVTCAACREIWGPAAKVSRHAAAAVEPAQRQALAAGPRHAKSAAKIDNVQLETLAGSASPARFTDLELRILDRPLPAGAPVQPSLAPAAEPYRAIQRDNEHELVFSAFDAGFWAARNEEIAQSNQRANRVHAETAATALAMDARLARLEASRAAWDGLTSWLYEGQLAQAVTPLPRRTPGAAKAAVDAEAELTDLAVAR